MPCSHKNPQTKILNAGEAYWLDDKEIIVSKKDAPLQIITQICDLTGIALSPNGNKCNVKSGYKDCKGQL